MRPIVEAVAKAEMYEEEQYGDSMLMLADGTRQSVVWALIKQARTFIAQHPQQQTEGKA